MKQKKIRFLYIEVAESERIKCWCKPPYDKFERELKVGPAVFLRNGTVKYYHNDKEIRKDND